VKGIDAIEHTASPFHFAANDPHELIRPAVEGTVGILESVLKYGQSVKRVVVTSSTAAIEISDTTPRVFSELDWGGEKSVQILSEQGGKAAGREKYRASKTLAEKAAWKWYADRKDLISWDLVVLNPSFVSGPFIHEVRDAASLNTSAANWYKSVVADAVSDEALVAGSSYVDVWDLAQAHVKPHPEGKGRWGKDHHFGRDVFDYGLESFS